MKKLIKGLHKFQTEVFPIQKDFFENLALMQDPETLFITCSDSRINPHLVTSSSPGDLFLLRNAGNIVPPYESMCSETATIEFAVCELNIKHIIICGHSHCGALKAAFNLDVLKKLPHLYSWIDENITPTLDFVRENYDTDDQTELLNILMQEHVLQQIENLKTHPCVAKAIEKKQITLHAWIYVFEEGDIFSYNQDDEQFESIKHI